MNKVQGLDGRSYPWRIKSTQLNAGEQSGSKYHKRARLLLRHFFPHDRILEEVPLPGCPTSVRADFYLPSRNLIIEVQGEQHFKFTQVFHGTRAGFLAALRRDQSKRDWCNLNNIILVEFPYYEDDLQWRHRLSAK